MKRTKKKEGPRRRGGIRVSSGLGLPTARVPGPIEAYAKLEPKITVMFNGQTKVENARFEDVHRGGLLMRDPADFKKWKNVTFGDGCLSKDPNDIFREFKKEGHRGPPSLREQRSWPVVKKYISM